MVHNIRQMLRTILRRKTILHEVGESAQRALWRCAPQLFNWKVDKSKIEIELTTRCSLRCYNCSRSIRQAPSDEYMSIEQLTKFVKESIDLNWRWKEIKLMGGEPTLHPDFAEVLDTVYDYKKIYPDCVVLVITNGYGERVREVLSDMPGWVTVSNRVKTTNVHRFQSYNLAPIDIEKFMHANFARGCFIIEDCGLGLNRYGYFCCGPGAGVDRVFGFDIGIKSLSALTDEALRDQLRCLCRYCGHYKYNYKEEWVTTEEISASWRAAFEKYREQRPALTLY